jgi:cell division FtsZ-interacting protein ZapD
MEQHLDYDIVEALGLDNTEVVRRYVRLREIFRLLNEMPGFSDHVSVYRNFKRIFEMVEVQAWVYHLRFEDTKDQDIQKTIERMCISDLPDSHKPQAIYSVVHVTQILCVSCHGAIAIYKVRDSLWSSRDYRESIPVFCKYDAEGRDVFGRVRTQEQVTTL